MLGLHKSTDDVFQAFNTFNGQNKKTPGLQPLHLAILSASASAFARADRMMASLAWAAADDEPSEASQMQANDDIEQIGKSFREATVETNAEAINKIMETSKAIESLSKASEPPESLLHLPTNEGFSGSNLDAQAILEGSIRDGLQLLLQALIRQLQCCDNEHLLRLRLSGFIHQMDNCSRLFFDVFLSSRYEWTPPRWVQSRCTVTNVLGNPESVGCHILRHAEEANKELSILFGNNNSQATPEKHPKSRECGHFLSQIPILKVENGRPVKSAAAPNKSLWELLKRGDTGRDPSDDENSDYFSGPDRERICLNLALSLLQLSTTHWRHVRWCSDRSATEGIFFLKDPANQRIVDKTRPYLSCRLDDNPWSKADDSLICDPQLLDFAKLITEIFMWKRLPLSGKDGNLSGEELRVYLLRLINNPRFFGNKQKMFTRAVEAGLTILSKM